MNTKILIAIALCAMGWMMPSAAAQEMKKKSECPHTYVKVVTNQGNFTLLLFEDTPLHYANFVKLCKSGAYNGTLFHRVIKDFLIQGGDPTSKAQKPGILYGDADGGYTVPAEILSKYFCRKGALIDAKEGDDVNPERGSAGTQWCVVQGKKFTDEQLDRTEARMNDWFRNQLYCQAILWVLSQEGVAVPVESDTLTSTALFEARRRVLAQVTPAQKERARAIADRRFETEGPIRLTAKQRAAYKTEGGTPHLDGTVSIFGQLIEGQEVVERITQQATDSNDRPLQDVIVKRTRVFRK